MDPAMGAMAPLRAMSESPLARQLLDAAPNCSSLGNITSVNGLDILVAQPRGGSAQNKPPEGPVGRGWDMPIPPHLPHRVGGHVDVALNSFRQFRHPIR